MHIITFEEIKTSEITKATYIALLISWIGTDSLNFGWHFIPLKNSESKLCLLSSILYDDIDKYKADTRRNANSNKESKAKENDIILRDPDKYI